MPTLLRQTNRAIETINKNVTKNSSEDWPKHLPFALRDIGPQCVFQQIKYHYHLSMEVKLQYYFIENEVFKEEKCFIPYSRESMKEH